MFTLNFKKKFLRKSKKLFKNNENLQKRFYLFLNILKEKPFYPSLKTHKINDVDSDTNYSSRLTGDLRIIWNFNNGTAEIIDLIDIGGHSGGGKIYN